MLNIIREDPRSVAIQSIKVLPLFPGMTGNVVLDEYGDREPDYWIMDMEPATGVFLKIAEILNTDSGGRVTRPSNVTLTLFCFNTF